MQGLEKDNANPLVFASDVPTRQHDVGSLGMDNSRDALDALEVFELVRNINDPEHPLTLEQLHVVTVEQVTVQGVAVKVQYTPTIPHCSMATLIGLCIRVKLLRSLPRRYKVSVGIAPGAHSQEEAVNKQLNDKERVAAAMENKHLLDVVNKCLEGSDRLSGPPLTAAAVSGMLGALAPEPTGGAAVVSPLASAASPGLRAIAAAAAAPAVKVPGPPASSDGGVNAWFLARPGFPVVNLDPLAE